MPCMCGDTYCPSCGPAQGNSRCYYCGAWSADGGCADAAACDAKAKADADGLAEELEEEAQLAEAWKRQDAEERHGWRRP